jgi:hypothetical protein
MRRLTIGGKTFLWRVRHHHVPDPASADGLRCREVLTVYREGSKQAPLRVTFSAGEGRGAGSPEAGVVTIYGPPHEPFNLNEPGIVSSIIAKAVETGWDPEAEHRPHEIEDGFALLLAVRGRTRD